MNSLENIEKAEKPAFFKEQGPFPIKLKDDGCCYVSKPILYVLFKTSQVFHRLLSDNQPPQLPYLSEGLFKTIVDLLQTGTYHKQNVLHLLEGLSILECRGLSNNLQAQVAEKINEFKLTEQNFIQTINGYLWAIKWDLKKVQESCRIFIQNYLEANFDTPTFIQIKEAIDFVNENSQIELSLNLANFVPSSDSFKRLKDLSDSVIALRLPLRARLSQSEVECLRDLSKLNSLIFTCKTLQSLNLDNLTNLRILALPNSDINDDDLASLRNIPLTILNLDRCHRITGIGLKYINPLLTSFTLSGVTPFFKDLAAEVLQRLGSFETLTVLKLKRTTINSEDLPSLYSLKNLTLLDLSHSPKIADWAIKNLQPMVTLVHLFLNKCPIKGWGLHDLPNNLQTLSLKDTPLEGEFLKLLVPLPRLFTLILEKCTDISPPSYHTLGSLTSLTALNLSESRIRDDIFEYIRILPRLTQVDVSNCHFLSDEASALIYEQVSNHTQNPFPRSSFMQQTAGLSFIEDYDQVVSEFEPIYLEKEEHKKFQEETRAENERLRKLFEETISRFEKEREECLTVMGEQKRDIERLSNENESFASEISKIQKTLEEKDLLIARQQKKEAKHKRKIVNLSKTLEDLQKLWEDQVASFAAEKDCLEKQLAQNLERDLASEQKIADLAKTIEDLQEDSALMKKLFEEQVASLANEKAELESLLNKREIAYEKKIADSAEAMQGLAGRVQKLQDMLNDNEKELDLLREQKTKIKEKKDKLKLENAALIAKNNELESEKVEKENKNESDSKKLKRQIRNNEKEIRQLQSQNQALNTQISQRQQKKSICSRFIQIFKRKKKAGAAATNIKKT
ncbi:MAG: hypothetical protein CK425_08195 [Parachlamydia sp.]|nr:MAG: hypothetical protein CK425_08195 [Parachlamydia sp.]